MEEEIKQMKEGMKRLLEDEEFFVLSAKVSMKLFRELRNEGFRPDEAIQIVSANQRK